MIDGVLRFAVEVVWSEKISRDIHLVLVLEGDLLQGHLVAGIEVAAPFDMS